MLFQNRQNECILGTSIILSIFFSVLKTSKLNILLHKAIELLQNDDFGLSPQLSSEY